MPDTAEQPGKVMHELRQRTLTIPGEGVSLPPLYYGTVDATPLWVCLLHDAWRWGLPDDEVEAARRLVQVKLRSLRRAQAKRPEGLEQDKVVRRLVGMLARKGHSSSVAFRVVKEELHADVELHEDLG